IRLAKAKKGLKLFSPEEIRTLLAAARPQIKAMILLGINCGFGNADCGKLPLSALDLDRGWADYPRPKTGIPRRCPLWPETVEAIRETLRHRPAHTKQKEHAGLVFTTKHGTPWAKDSPANPLAREMSRLVRASGLGGRKALGFYTLRHTFRTVGDEAKDQPAID